MGREISMNSMVRLPRLNKDTVVSLVWQMLTVGLAAKGDGFPPVIERALARLAAALEVFKEAMLPRETGDPKVRLEAAREMGAAWRSFAAWLDAMVGMPDEGAPPDLPSLRTLHTLILSDGLSFIRMAHREQWPQSEKRLTVVDDGEYAPIIERCGGAAFLGPLRTAHERFGEVLGITAPVQVEESAEVREQISELSSVLRSYICKVVAYADPEEPGSEDLSEALLVPLVQWKDAPAHPNHEDEDENSQDLNGDTAEFTLPVLDAAPN